MSLLSVDAARRAVFDAVPQPQPERVPLVDAGGRVLAEPLSATRSLPAWDCSAMDGYAVRAIEAARGAVLPISAALPAGTDNEAPLPVGTVMRIFTGAPLPPGADTVVMQENTRVEGDRVRFVEAAEPGRHVRRAGNDVAAGADLLSPGRALTTGDIGLAAALGRTGLSVFRRPTVAIACSGDELIEPDAGPPRRGQIVSSNGVALAAAVREVGGVPLLLPILPDDRAATRAALRRALHADVLLTSGGVSVGDHDHVGPALQHLCDEGLTFWKVAIKPGKPIAFGRAGRCLCFGLPGNPVSALVTFEIFVRPALLALQGHQRTLRRPRQAILAAPLLAGGARRQYLRASLRPAGDGWTVDASRSQSSGALSSIGGADALVPIAIDAPARPSGSTIDVLLLGPDTPLERLPFEWQAQ